MIECGRVYWKCSVLVFILSIVFKAVPVNVVGCFITCLFPFVCNTVQFRLQLCVWCAGLVPFAGTSNFAQSLSATW